MDRPAVEFGFSTCPNDTFAFHALVHGLVPGPRVVPFLADIEVLNERAERGEAEVTKVSTAALGRLRDRYVLLRSGGAAGFGVGPIVVARSARDVGGRIAIPGERTTAALLLRLLGRFETVAMRFDRIEDAVLRGDADCGLLIHEGRFTYEAKGLTLVADLGTVWEERMQCPLPLAAHRHPPRSGAGAGADGGPGPPPERRICLRASRGQPRLRGRARQGDGSGRDGRRHIRLYVNDYTLALDEDAVQRMMTWAEHEGLFPPGNGSLPLFA